MNLTKLRLRKCLSCLMYVLLILITLITLSDVPALSQDQSHVQIKCEADIKVFLDGQYVGKTLQDQQGLLLQSISPGRHLISFQKNGFEEVRMELELRPGEVRIVEPDAFKRRSGLLVVQSLPVNIIISLQPPSEKFQKEEDLWSSDLTEGKYTAVFANGTNSLRADFTIKYNRATGLFVNFPSSTINTSIYPRLEGKYQVVGSGKLLGTISDMDISFEPIATGLRGRISGPDGLPNDNTLRLSHSLKSIKAGEKSLEIVWRVLLAGQADGRSFEKPLDCLISGRIEKSLSEIPVILKIQHPIISNRTIDSEGKLLKLTEITKKARRDEEKGKLRRIEQWRSSMAGAWNIRLFGNEVGELSLHDGIRVSQSGNSITFQTYRRDGKQITWKGQYSNGRLNAAANYSRIQRSARLTVNLTMTGEMDSSGNITGEISGKELQHDIDGDFPDDTLTWDYSLQMERVQ